ncbi:MULTISPECIES: hypothetical protein [unclassified Streptomyces]|uniref:hypothetical protein n=1 Tax=unclassified Streptomyces TaxID=2593676 RepID=UPI0038170656
MSKRIFTGLQPRLVFVDRVVVTRVALRFQLPHAALAELHRVDRSTVTRAIRDPSAAGNPRLRRPQSMNEWRPVSRGDAPEG